MCVCIAMKMIMAMIVLWQRGVEGKGIPTSVTQVAEA